MNDPKHANWIISDQLVHAIAQTPVQFGEEYTDEPLQTQTEVNQTAVAMLAVMNDETKLIVPNTAAELGITMPPDMTEWYNYLMVDLKRSPSDWEPRTVTILDQQFQQVVPYQRGRDSITIYNGSANLTLSRNQVNLTNGDQTHVIPVLQGASLTLKTEGPIWVTGVLGTTFNVIITYWDRIKMGDAAEDGLIDNVREMIVD